MPNSPAVYLKWVLLFVWGGPVLDVSLAVHWYFRHPDHPLYLSSSVIDANRLQQRQTKQYREKVNGASQVHKVLKMLPPSVIERILRKLKVIIDDGLTCIFSQPVNAARANPDTSRYEVSNERAPHLYMFVNNSLAGCH